jgi:hypothetical protein
LAYNKNVDENIKKKSFFPKEKTIKKAGRTEKEAETFSKGWKKWKL